MCSVSETRSGSIELMAAASRPWKVVMDWCLAAILLILTAPIMLAAMLLVRLTSGGPALYWQTRLGAGGRTFTIYKIRTMYRDCERLTGPRWSTPGDPRVTPIGRILRATHIDELPQLWNILRAEMSLIGPRPERPEIAAQLEQALPAYRERLRVRPGVSGLAQVKLPPDTNLESVRRKLGYDIYYINNMTLYLDIRIIIVTALAIISPLSDPACRWFRIPGADVAELPEADQSGETAVLAERCGRLARVTSV